MKPEQHVSVCVLLILSVTWSANGGNILVWFTDGSHWINMKPVLEMLVDRGHQVKVLVPSTSMFMNSNEPSRFGYEPFNVSISIETMEEFFEEYLRFSMYEMDHMSYVQLYIKYMDLMRIDLQYALKFLDGVLKSETIMKKLKDGKYLLLVDPIYPGGDLLAEILGIPLVYSLRFSLAHNWERYCGQLPAPPSFVPGAMSKLTDKMDFSERVWNFLFYALQDIVMSNIFWKELDKYYSEVKGTPTSACETMGRADIWLMRTYWDFDFPRPFLPNFKFVGGIHCRPAKPLPEDMEEFVQSSGDAGIVVFTLGSFIKNITTEKGNMVASALAQIPQKVLWRYSGEKPATLGANTRIYNWIPQNDLLGHPKTRAFITHGGTNGIYEAIYHGVPMVGLPQFADQPDNMVHMKAKGAAIIADINFMKTEELRDAFNTVINENSIFHDRPMNPRDEAVFWIEFTMRNKGAKHLRVQAHELTWYQYHSLDVLAFLFTIVLFLILLFINTCSFCFRRCCGRKGKTKRKADANGGNILVWFTEGSHWINMKPVLETLVDRGHQVKVLVPSTSMFMNSSEPSRFGYEPFNVSFSLEAMEEFFEEYLRFSMYEMDHLSYVQLYIKYMDLMRVDLQYALKFLDGVLKSETIMKKLKEGKYDLLLADPIYPGSELVAEILGIPLVLSVRFSVAHNWERYCGQLPAPPSFVPGAMSKLTDKMDFSESVELPLLRFARHFDDCIHNFCIVTGTPTSACETMGRADIWLMRTYWDFDFPRPFLPNFKFVGGIHCRQAKPLPEDMEEFVQSSGDAGIVVFTLGSFIKNITTEKGNMVASALAQIPQKVRGQSLMSPQDQGFHHHGGTNGIYEAIYHGVPMVGLPQYKEKAMWLSTSIFHDRPMSPRDEAVFWIEFTMRNKGAKHLRAQAHELTWYQYHSLDVLAFLLAIVLFLILLFINTCSYCFRRCGRKGKTKRKAEMVSVLMKLNKVSCTSLREVWFPLRSSSLMPENLYKSDEGIIDNLQITVDYSHSGQLQAMNADDTYYFAQEQAAGFQVFELNAKVQPGSLASSESWSEPEAEHL
ncbi:hypothetical protein F7725_013125 [Dissostichus mawsoni]|uniref:glucuronosyltransferase n=1 Tax=Dissostichus mawsoni TaxID=36200 RepID=A0A7J5YQG7_DISMA|nr:hypothetical protein F7725_013125 [Dissostichus mawsoni]